jgi:hypothetical protein
MHKQLQLQQHWRRQQHLHLGGYNSDSDGNSNVWQWQRRRWLHSGNYNSDIHSSGSGCYSNASGYGSSNSYDGNGNVDSTAATTVTAAVS